jgi:hypothetical protein
LISIEEKIKKAIIEIIPMAINIRRVSGYEFGSSEEAYRAFRVGSRFRIDRERKVISNQGEIVGHLSSGNILVLEDDPRVRKEVNDLRGYLDSLAGTS